MRARAHEPTYTYKGTGTCSFARRRILFVKLCKDKRLHVYTYDAESTKLTHGVAISKSSTVSSSTEQANDTPKKYHAQPRCMTLHENQASDVTQYGELPAYTPQHFCPPMVQRAAAPLLSTRLVCSSPSPASRTSLVQHVHQDVRLPLPVRPRHRLQRLGVHRGVIVSVPLVGRGGGGVRVRVGV